jgi:hypothetical protein
MVGRVFVSCACLLVICITWPNTKAITVRLYLLSGYYETWSERFRVAWRKLIGLIPLTAIRAEGCWSGFIVPQFQVKFWAQLDAFVSAFRFYLSESVCAILHLLIEHHNKFCYSYKVEHWPSRRKVLKYAVCGWYVWIHSLSGKRIHF